MVLWREEEIHVCELLVWQDFATFGCSQYNVALKNDSASIQSIRDEGRRGGEGRERYFYAGCSSFLENFLNFQKPSQYFGTK